MLPHQGPCMRLMVSVYTVSCLCEAGVSTGRLAFMPTNNQNEALY